MLPQALIHQRNGRAGPGVCGRGLAPLSPVPAPKPLPGRNVARAALGCRLLLPGLCGVSSWAPSFSSTFSRDALWPEATSPLARRPFGPDAGSRVITQPGAVPKGLGDVAPPDGPTAARTQCGPA